MNGPHDLGGQMGFGPINPEADEPVFHHDWEGRVLGVTLCAGAVGPWNLDKSRFSRESLAPSVYYSSTYYEIWLAGLEQLLVDADMVTADELAAGRSVRESSPPKRILTADRVSTVLGRGSPVSREPVTEAKFTQGQPVKTKVMHPKGHTRLPRYARGKHAVIESVAGCHIYPDAHANDEGESPQWLYTIRFDASELWGADAEASTTVCIDAWEPYLEPC